LEEEEEEELLYQERMCPAIALYFQRICLV